jgi:hypothetical protein
MSEQEINDAIGRTAVNIRTQSRFTVIDFRRGCFYLSGGQVIPVDAFVRFWQVVK